MQLQVREHSSPLFLNLNGERQTKAKVTMAAGWRITVLDVLLADSDFTEATGFQEHYFNKR